MGVYYKWVCDERKETLDGNDIGVGIKHPDIAEVCSAVALLVTFGSWRGCSVRLLWDTGQPFEDMYNQVTEDGYTDAGKEAENLLVKHGWKFNGERWVDSP